MSEEIIIDDEKLARRINRNNSVVSEGKIDLRSWSGLRDGFRYAELLLSTKVKGDPDYSQASEILK